PDCFANFHSFPCSGEAKQFYNRLSWKMLARQSRGHLMLRRRNRFMNSPVPALTPTETCCKRSVVVSACDVLWFPCHSRFGRLSPFLPSSCLNLRSRETKSNS